MQKIAVPKKWRPSLALLIAVVVGTLVVLPFAALIGARVTSNQFVRETEANLHAQAAIYAEIFAQSYALSAQDAPAGWPLDDAQKVRLAEDWHPIALSIFASNETIQPPRADPLPSVVPPDAVYVEIGKSLSLLAERARKTTLVGLLALDVSGNIIGKSGSDTGNMAHLDEVARGLRGEFVAVARWRDDEYRNHSLRSASRDTKFRVYVVHPVIVRDHVVGAVYLSRTPSNLNKYLFSQRHSFLWLLAAVALAAAVIGFFLWRFLARPMRDLTMQARDIAGGQSETRLSGYGVQELAQVGQSLIDMGATLRRNADSLQTYTKHATHELKSPVTAIMGAAELLESDKVDDTRRQALAQTIKADAARMDQLLVRMRDMARGQVRFGAATCSLASIVEEEFVIPVDISGDAQAILPLPLDAAQICLGHLIENAKEHGATRVQLFYSEALRRIEVEDNGAGISTANLNKVTEPFFTTKRESGGTGMGLNICAEIVGQFGGRLSVDNTALGARITLQF